MFVVFAVRIWLLDVWFNSVVYVSVVCGGYLLCVCCFGAVV